MATVNQVIIVGRLKKDAVVNRGPKPTITASVETFKAVKDRSNGGTKWITQVHNVLCTKEALVSVLETHGKAGRFVRVSGELTYDGQGRATILVGVTGDMGMMNTVGGGVAQPSPEGAERSSSHPASQNSSLQKLRQGVQADQTFTDGGEAGASEPAWETVGPSSSNFESHESDIPF